MSATQTSEVDRSPVPSSDASHPTIVQYLAQKCLFSGDASETLAAALLAFQRHATERERECGSFVVSPPPYNERICGAKPKLLPHER